MNSMAPQSARLAAGAAAVGLLACLFTGPARAAGSPPSVVTGTVSSVSSTSVVLNGSVDPNGLSTSASFEYGPTTTYGSQTTSQTVGSGTANSAVTVTLTGLTPGTTYHYRLDATSSAGTTNGSDGIFTTPSAPGAVTAAATGLTSTAATLNATVDPNGEATTFSFQYGSTTAYGLSTPSTSAGSGTAAVAFAASVSGLLAGQTYHFRVVAQSSAGTTMGADLSFTLAAAPAVTTNPATSVTSTSAKVNGTVNPNGQATTWQFQYGTTASYGLSTSPVSLGAGNAATSVSATLSGLANTASTVYHYRLVATNASGTVDGSDRTFGTSEPPVVATGSAQNAGPTSVTLTGSVDPRGASTSWYFQYGTTTAYGSTSTLRSAGSGGTAVAVSAPITKLLSATTYHYRIVATSKAGTSDGGDVTFTTPVAVTLVAESSESVFGRAVTLSGIAAGSPAGAKISVLAQPIGQTSFSTAATVTTGTGGAWSFQARPTIATSYEASSGSGTSAAVTIGVRPAITLRQITGARLLIRVVGSVPFTGKIVQIQRLRPLGGWRTVARSRLNGRSSTVVPASVLPRGSSTVRIAMSVNQAGRGFLAGFSRTLVITRS